MQKVYFFIDESGDPSFYAKGKKSLVGTEGFKPVLLIGMICLEDKALIRNSIIDFVEKLKADPLYNTLPCLLKDDWYLHASYDNIGIQLKFVDFIRGLEGFKFFCVIGRKRLDVFKGKHNSNETEFYFDLVYHLLKDRLNKEDVYYQVFLSAREKNNQRHLKEAISNAITRDNNRRIKPIEIKYNSEIVRSKDTPELSIVDYMLWALQRHIIKNDDKFYYALKEKYNLIIDLYDFKNYKKNYYHRDNRFDRRLASVFEIDGYK